MPGAISPVTTPSRYPSFNWMDLETKRIQKMAVWQQYGFPHCKRSRRNLGTDPPFRHCVSCGEPLDQPWSQTQHSDVDALQWHKAIQSPKFGHVYT